MTTTTQNQKEIQKSPPQSPPSGTTGTEEPGGSPAMKSTAQTPTHTQRTQLSSITTGAAVYHNVEDDMDAAHKALEETPAGPLPKRPEVSVPTGAAVYHNVEDDMDAAHKALEETPVIK